MFPRSNKKQKASWISLLLMLGGVAFSVVLEIIPEEYYILVFLIVSIISAIIIVYILRQEIRSLSQITDVFELRIKKYHERFDFKKIFTEAPQDSTIQIHVTFLVPMGELLDDLEEALTTKNIKVQMLLLNPMDTDTIRVRTKEIEDKGWPTTEFLNGSIHSISQTIRKIKDLQLEEDQFVLKLYEGTLGTPMYIIRDEDNKENSKMFFSHYLTKPLVSSSHFELFDEKSELFKKFIKYFERKWNDKDNITLEITEDNAAYYEKQEKVLREALEKKDDEKT